MQGRRKLSHSRGRRTGSAGRELGCKARKETKAPTKVTWLGRAEREELPVKTSRGKGKGFKEAVLRGDKIKFLQQGQQRESCSPAHDCRAGMIGFGKECGTPLVFFLLLLKKQEWGQPRFPLPRQPGPAFVSSLCPGGLRGAVLPPAPCPRLHACTQGHTTQGTHRCWGACITPIFVCPPPFYTLQYA